MKRGSNSARVDGASNGKGQNKITSFFATHAKPTRPQQHSTPATPVPLVQHASPAAALDTSAEDVIMVDDEQPAIQRPAKKSRQGPAEAGAPRSGSSTLDVDAVVVRNIPARSLPRASKARTKLVTGQTDVQRSGQQQQQHSSASSLLSVPAGIKLTPLEQQVVALKRQYPDVLLLVEVGYKMRFFGEDADVASKICNIYCFPDHNFLTASVPVYRLPVYVRRLVQNGHKVGVVRQSETAALKAAGANKSAPFERKLTALYTSATLDAGQRADKIGEEESIQDYQENDGGARQGSGLSRYIMFVVEVPASSRTGKAGGPKAGRGDKAHGQQGAPISLDSDEEGDADGPAGDAEVAGPHPAMVETEVGLLAVEASTGDVQYGVCRSSLVQSELESALIMLAPCELVVVEPLTTATRRLLQSYQASCPGCRMEVKSVSGAAAVPFAADACGAKALEQQISAIFADDACSDAADRAAALALPTVVQRALLLAGQHLEAYGLVGVLKLASSFRYLAARSEMHLSANALRQLEVLSAGENGGVSGSLLHLLDRTRTPFGSRLMRHWLSHPLTDLALITQRLDAVQELLTGTDAGPLSRLSDVLGRLPDLERGITRLFHRTASPAEFVTNLQALAKVPEQLVLRVCPTTGASLPPEDVDSHLLRTLLMAAGEPSLHAAAKTLLGALHVKAAQANDFHAMYREDSGRFAAVFECKRALAKAEQHLQDLLPVIATQLGVFKMEYTSIQFQGNYLIEVPVENERRVPKGWRKVCSTKKVHRYHPPDVVTGMQQLEQAKERLAAAAKAAWHDFLGAFAVHYPACRAAVTALAHLDALAALAAVARSPNYCRPTFATGSSDDVVDAATDGTADGVAVRGDEADGRGAGAVPATPSGRQYASADEAPPQLVVVGGRHPMLDAQLQGQAVPNDLRLEWGGRRAAIITGPNMGGKSCLIRQAALIAIMAQVGSFVPATSTRLHVMDAIHTRMGASDNLMLGRSTFMEELGDASDIMARATRRSLVIVDELGRGTATHDGVAIATACLDYFVNTIQCLTLFVTHYPEVAALAAQQPKHMGACHMAFLRATADAESAPGRSAPAKQAVAGRAALAAPARLVALSATGREEAALRTPTTAGSTGETGGTAPSGTAAAPSGARGGGTLSGGTAAPSSTRGGNTSIVPTPMDVDGVGEASACPEAGGGSSAGPVPGAGVDADVAMAGGGTPQAVLAGRPHSDVDTTTAVTPCDAGTTTAVTPCAAGITTAVTPLTAPGIPVDDVVGAQPQAPRIVFLYKLQEGAAGESFGLNVASMAGLPPLLVARAAAKATELRAALERDAAARAGRLSLLEALRNVVASARAAVSVGGDASLPGLKHVRELAASVH